MSIGGLDGKILVKGEALNLPSLAFSIEQSRGSFLEKGLDTEDMVALLGKSKEKLGLIVLSLIIAKSCIGSATLQPHVPNVGG